MDEVQIGHALFGYRGEFMPTKRRNLCGKNTNEATLTEMWAAATTRICNGDPRKIMIN